MGAKTSMLVFDSTGTGVREALHEGARLDRPATAKLARTLHPHEPLQPVEDGDLSNTYPSCFVIGVGCFAQVAIVASQEFAIDRPSRLPRRFIEAGGSETVTLHVMHSVVDWFAYARWVDGQLVRAL